MKEHTDTGKAAYTEQQANISIMLVIAIILMVGVYMGCTQSSENDRLFQGAVIAPIITLLSGIYTFSYRGKGHLTSRVVFFILLALSIFSIGMLYYITELGKAFAH